MRTRRTTATLASLVLAGVVAAACGSDDAEVAGVVFEDEADTVGASEPDREDADGPAAPADEAEEGPEMPDAVLVLPAVASELGVHHVYGDEEVELGSGQVLEEEPVTRHLVADALVDRGLVRCQATLHAPADRPMAVAGVVTVALVLERRDGGVDTDTVQTLEVEAVIGAGDSMALDPSPDRRFDTSGLRVVRCEAGYTPG